MADNSRRKSSLLVKLLFVVAILLLLYYANKAVAAPQPQPRFGDHLCWYSSTQKQCGTYGWDKKESVAKAAALKLCLKECDDSCVLDYCEKLTREK